MTTGREKIIEKNRKGLIMLFDSNNLMCLKPQMDDYPGKYKYPKQMRETRGKGDKSLTKTDRQTGRWVQSSHAIPHHQPGGSLWPL